MFQTDDLRIDQLRPLIPPAILMEEFPLGEVSSGTVAHGREQVERILRGEDDRLLAVVGPCSVHDVEAGLEYGRRLHALAEEVREDVLVVMRVYFEKPRTIVGWKGLINDPALDESFRINEGLRLARGFLLDLAEMGLPAGSEFLDPISPQFMADVISWGAIGARTSESQVHRELASGLSMPVGFKNGTAGSVQLALDAIRSAAHPHHFLSVTKQGVAAIVSTLGNSDCHLILRGGSDGPNHTADAVASACEALQKAGLPERLVIDCSHANSGKDHTRQPATAEIVGAQIAAGNGAICGVMLESFLVEGRQDVVDGEELIYGRSITDACMGWETTVSVIEGLAAAVRARRG
ncbi:MAG: 3-deoxy-7-phosphoheptulonate synthase [Myxococcales bacterium]|nr:3-deoxy-7-phosphoheptulonate synthase [Myxococcales bacterium]